MTAVCRLKLVAPTRTMRSAKNTGWKRDGSKQHKARPKENPSDRGTERGNRSARATPAAYNNATASTGRLMLGREAAIEAGLPAMTPSPHEPESGQTQGRAGGVEHHIAKLR